MPHSDPVRPRRVLIIDDTRTIRALIRATLQGDGRFVVVGEAGDPYEAREAIKALKPDVITLDVEMPRMNGLVFLEHLMRLHPLPVVMVSTRTREQSADAIRALSLGAIDCVDVARIQADPAQRARLADTLFHAAGASVRRPGSAARTAPRPSGYRPGGRIVLIGSSTGGVDALERVFADWPETCPPTLVAQHMPPAFLASFVARLDDMIAPAVRLAREGEPILPGTIHVAPGGAHHLALAGRAHPVITLPEATGQELYVPEVDTLFTSACPVAPRILGVVLTGMGRDGAAGLAALRARGAETLVQSADSAVIDGMPRAAREAGAAQTVLPLDEIGPAILTRCAAGARRAADAAR